MKIIYILLFFLISPFAIPVKSQITIGSDEKPNIGAILDLKEHNTSGANSAKGLMLPRVILTRKDMLYPMLPNNYDKSIEDANHTGLVVYNASNSYFLEQSGPYVWNGKEWEYLIDEGEQAQDLFSYTDQEENKFLAAKFGDAGIWMVQNLQAKTFDPIRDLDNETLYTNIKIRYPNNDEQLTMAYPWMGIFYDFYTATNNYNWQKISSGTESQNDRVQGICPNGWHVPSTHEWHRLEAVLINETKKHTSLDKDYVSEGVVHEALVTGANNLEKYGKAYRPAFIDPAPMPGYNNTIDGVSLKPTLGGFAVRMVGVMKLGTNNEFNAVDEYGTKAGFWVAYSYNSSNGRNRVFLNDVLYNNNGGKDRYYSVRCVKNDNIP